MKIYPKIILWFLIFTFSHGLFSLYGKDSESTSHSLRIIIPKVVLLDIESANTKNITLKMNSPSEAGEPLISAIDNRLWLNVTSIVESGSPTNITARIDDQISGIDLNVKSEPYSGSGYGKWGTTQPTIILNTIDQAIVSGIKSGISGNGANNGFNIKYIAQTNDPNYGEIVSSGNNAVTVTYTLTQ